ILLSTIAGTQGNAAPLATLPSGFVNTGENVGSGLGNDGTINGILPITVSSTNLSNANFGIYNCPTITNPSAHQTICMGSLGNNISVQTNSNASNSIKFVKFSSNPIAGAIPTALELATIYAGTTIATVTPTGTSPNFTATYTWNSNDFINNTNTPITYYIYAISNPDAGTTCKPYQEIKVTVNPLPTVASITGLNTVCVGSTTTLSSTTVNGVWSSSNNAIATINSSGVVTGISAGNVTITYTVTNMYGCSSAITSLVTVVSPASLPTITASGPTTACLGAGLTLSSSIAASYQWFKDGVAVVGATNQTHIPTVSGTYTMVIISGGGSCNAISNAIPVVINYAATPSIAPLGDTVIICTKNNDKICPATWGYSNYQWYKNGVAIAAPIGTASCLYPTT
ncbi:MAG: Ig-like domain-containing protein, partial [Dolichospermum sp.]